MQRRWPDDDLVGWVLMDGEVRMQGEVGGNWSRLKNGGGRVAQERTVPTMFPDASKRDNHRST